MHQLAMQNLAANAAMNQMSQMNQLMTPMINQMAQQWMRPQGSASPAPAMSPFTSMFGQGAISSPNLVQQMLGQVISNPALHSNVWGAPGQLSMSVTPTAAVTTPIVSAITATETSGSQDVVMSSTQPHDSEQEEEEEEDYVVTQFTADPRSKIIELQASETVRHIRLKVKKPLALSAGRVNYMLRDGRRHYELSFAPQNERVCHDHLSR